MTSKTIRYIPELGGHYICYDIGCIDFEHAAQNRYMVHHRLHTFGYVLVEEAVRHTPLNQPLATWIPQGQLPSLRKQDRGREGGVAEIKLDTPPGDMIY